MLVLRWAVRSAAWQPSPAQWQLLLEQLPPDERARVLRFARADDRRRALLSQLLQRAAAAAAAGEPDWRRLPAGAFARTRGGKPFYAAAAPRPPAATAPNWSFNVAHEGEWVVLAAEPWCLVGADVAAPRQLRLNGGGSGVDGQQPEQQQQQQQQQQERPFAEALALMRGELADSEWELLQEQLAAGGAAACEAAFLACWASKEAVAKARGDGVAFGLRRLEVRPPPALLLLPPPPQLQEEGALQAAAPAAPVQLAGLLLDGAPAPRWRVFLQRLPGGHVAAVARGAPGGAVDADGRFAATLRRRDLDDEALAAALDAPSPPFDVLGVEDLLPAALADAYDALE